MGSSIQPLARTHCAILGNRVLSLKGVSKEYSKGQVKSFAVRDVSLGIGRGELVCLAGKSGSGKTTLLGMLGLINMPTSGQIHFDGVDVTASSDAQRAKIRRNKIGIVFQQFNLLPALSAVENVMYPLYMLKDDKAREKALEALAEVDMVSLANRKPKQLSGGQMQRVSIARAFAKKPELIIADEPTANLDVENAQIVYQLLQRLNQEKGVTVVIATHDRDFSERCGRTVGMLDGKLV
jgi:putative ABC transport system ATP-binding protein